MLIVKQFFRILFFLLPITVAAQSFVPSDLPNLDIWFTADSESYSDGQQVPSMRDLSINANNAVQGTPSSQPIFVASVPEINNHAAVRFDGIDDYLQFAQVSDIRTVFWVIREAAGASYNYRTLLSGTSDHDFLRGDLGQFWRPSSVSSFILDTAGGARTRLGPNVIDGVTTLIPQKYSLISVITTGNVRADNFSWAEHFSDRFWQGDLAELIIYNQPLADSDRIKVENYLRAKYAPPVDLGPDVVLSSLCPYTLHAGNQYVSYMWNNTPADSDSVLTVTHSGTYYVQVTDVFGFTSTDTVTVTYPFTQLADTNFCYGNTAIWNTGLDNVNYTYAWSDGSSANTLSITSTGQYSVTVTEIATSCTFTSQTVNVVVDTFAQTVSLGPDMNICSGANIGLVSANPTPVSYLWSPGGETTATIPITATGTYSVTVQDAQGCTASDTVIDTVVGTAPIVGFTADSVCVGDTTHFVDTSSDPPNSIVSWHWDFGNLATTNDTDTISNPVYVYPAAGTYSVRLDVVSSTGCSNFIIKNVIVYPKPTAAFSTSSSCIGTPTLFYNSSDSVGDSAPTWAWDFGDASGTSSVTSPSYTYAAISNYNVQLIVATSHGCSDTTSQNVTVHPLTYCFSPAQIGGLDLWFAADSELFGNGQHVDTLHDLFAPANNAVAPTDTTKQPIFISSVPEINNQPAVRFDGSGDWLKFVQDGNIRTVFWVIKEDPNATSNFRDLLGGSTTYDFLRGANKEFWNINSASTSVKNGETRLGPNIISGTTTVVPPQYILASIVTTGPVTAENFSWDQEFSDRFWQGDLAELIIYDQPLNATDRVQVENYLRNKYAPPVDLGPDIAMTSLCPVTLHANGNYTNYTWNGNVTNLDSLVVTHAGQYAVVVTDVFGFTSTDTVNVTYPVPPPPVTDTILCYGNSVTWNTGLNPSNYTFAWSNGETTASVAISLPGAYSVTITENATSCSMTSDTMNVLVDMFSQTVSLGNDTTFCGGQTIGLVSATPSPVSYVWAPGGETTSTIVVNNTDTFSVIVTDSVGCIATDSVIITVQGTAPTINFTDSLFCFGDSTSFWDLTTDTPPHNIVSWHWDFGVAAGDTSNQQNPKFVYPAPGTYSVHLDVLSSSGCGNSITRNITIYPKPSAAFSYVQPLCAGDTVQFTDASTISSGNLTGWNWDFGDPSSGSNSSSAQDTIHVYSSTGGFNAQLIVTSDHGCLDTATNAINVISNNCTLPTAIGGLRLWLAADHESYSNGQPVSIWNDLAGGNNATQPISVSQPLYVSSVHAINDKPAVHFDGLTQPHFLEFNPINDVRTVFWVIKEDTGVPVFTYRALLGHSTLSDFIRGDNNQFWRGTASPFITDTAARTRLGPDTISGTNTVVPQGKYMLVSLITTDTVHASNFSNDQNFARYWQGDLAELIIYNQPLSDVDRLTVETYLRNKYAPPVNIGPDIVMSSVCPHTIYAQDHFTSYIWNGDTTNVDSFVVHHSGQYIVIATDVFGFTSTDTVNVTYPLIQPNAHDTICVGNALTLNTGLSSPYTFLWSNGETTSSISVTTAGAYSVTVTDINSCTMVSDTDSVYVDMFSQIINLGADPDTLCVGNLLYLTSGSNLVASYTWNDGSHNSTLAVSNTGWYWVTVTDSLHACTATDSIYVFIAGIAPITNFGFDTTCLGNSMQFHDSSDNTVLTWFWTFGDPASGSNDTSYIQNPTHLYSDTNPHVVTLIVTASGGCFGIKIDTVQVLPNPVPGFTYSLSCANTPIQFTNTSDTLGLAAVWHWDFGDAGNLDTSNLTSPSYTYSNTGTYTITLTVTLSTGCSATTTQTVNVQPTTFCFNPSSLPGLELWLAADSEHYNNGDLVDTLHDLSGNGRDATTAASDSMPVFHSPNPAIYNQPTVFFPGVKESLHFPEVDSIRTVFWVIRDIDTTATGNHRALLGHLNHDFQRGDNRVFWDFTQFHGNPAVWGGKTRVGPAAIDGATTQMSNEYSLVSLMTNDYTPKASNFSWDQNFADWVWKGDLAELIIYKDSLDVNQRIQVENYLRAKYAPPANLGPDTVMTSICPLKLTPGWWFKSYQWNNDTSLHDSVLTVVRSGQYIVNAVDIFGFTSKDTINVTYPFAELPPNNILCAGNTLTWNTLLTDTTLAFQWTGFPDTTSYLDITTEGWYQFTVTDNTLGCTFTSDSVFVDVDSLPVITAIAAGTDTTLCSGNTIRLIAGDGVTSYLWSDNTTDTAMLVTTSGMYWVQVTDSLGCHGTDSVNVIIGGIAPTAIFGNLPACQGDWMYFGDSSVANSGTINGYHWDFGDPGNGMANDTANAPLVQHLYTDTLPHLVTLTVFTDAGCQNYVTHWVRVIPKPQVNFTTTNACAGAAVNFFDSTVFIGDSPGNFVWYFGDAASGSLDTAYTQNPVHNYAAPGSYFVKLYAFSSHGCFDSTIKQVDVHKTVIPAFSTSSTCFGSIMSFFGTSNAGFQDSVNWYWTFGDGGTNSTTLTPTHFYASAGTYFVTLTATTNFNCIASSAHNVTVNPKPVANFDNSLTPCIGSPYTFVPTSTISSGSIACYDWDIIGVTQFSCNPAPVYTFNTLSTYNVKLTVISDANCTSNITKPVTVQPLPVPGFTMNPPFGPPALQVFFTNTSQNISSNTYSWNFGDGGTSALLAPQHTYTDTGNYCVWMTATSAFGCKDSVTDCIYVIRPRRDVAVQDIWATAANNTLTVSARIANLGTVNINQVLMKASFPDGTSIQELDEAGLQTGQADTFYFAAALTVPVTANHDYYCVEAILTNGQVDDVPSNNKKCEAIVDDFSIVEPYPNPFSGNVNLDVVLPYDDHLTIEVFNSIGQSLQTIYDGQAYAGLNSISADLSSLAEGMYAVRFTFRDNMKVKEVMKVSRKK